jgi:hypothetical protein
MRKWTQGESYDETTNLMMKKGETRQRLLRRQLPRQTVMGLVAMMRKMRWMLERTVPLSILQLLMATPPTMAMVLRTKPHCLVQSARNGARHVALLLVPAWMRIQLLRLLLVVRIFLFPSQTHGRGPRC